MTRHNVLHSLHRRQLFQNTSLGLGSIALGSLLAETLPASDSISGQDPLAARLGHFPATAKNVIFLHMIGAPSHLDLFEDKPLLRENDGQLCPDEFLEGQRFAFLRGHPKLLGSRVKFQQHGDSGLVLSEYLPHLAKVADEIAMVKTVQTELFNHAPAQLFFQTGFGRFGRPSVGSWVSYGLGSENRDLPAFVVLITGSVAGAGNSLWGSGFLPTVHQGVEFRGTGDPILFLSNPAGVSDADRRRLIDDLNALNQHRLADVADPEIATRISQYELAYRMQSSAPELMELSQESQATLDMYGAKRGGSGFANNCLLARRLVERGVRFVQLFDQGWDHHGGVFKNLPNKCKQVDQPIAALIQDLKSRGLLDETLIVWGAEFGRTPLLQGDAGKAAGRDHHKDAFCLWMAGGGVRGGVTVGKTDELGYFPVEDPFHVHDVHATILHLLGLDHTRLTFKHQGRNFRLTDVAGKLIKPIIA